MTYTLHNYSIHRKQAERKTSCMIYTTATGSVEGSAVPTERLNKGLNKQLNHCHPSYNNVEVCTFNNYLITMSNVYNLMLYMKNWRKSYIDIEVE